MVDNEEKNTVDEDFKDIQESEKKGYIKIVIILYIIVAILTFLLIFGISHQKSVVKNSINNNVEDRG